MQINFLLIVIGSLVSLAFVYVLTNELQWGALSGLLILIGGLKFLRIRKREANDEIEYDERVNDNLRTFTLQSFAFSQLLLLIYLLISQLFFNQQHIQSNYLILYLSITFIISFFIGPSIVRKR
ncbi:hypothetical protein QUF49_15765 [Fictibacillus sp. b24]|uniref:hypothetical protein n=1 Tax=Fictibacillus sp. b24 TaxID=3055863 RepID=UPI0025A18898|nr:hypothetical protein [Fictibacillus sp. b24]MDM5317468.1 hypothetical protein [Fictibacillus sp. b24]